MTNVNQTTISSNNNKSATLKSNCTLEDYNTPPESPGIQGSAENISGFRSPMQAESPVPPPTDNVSDFRNPVSVPNPPVPPPRTKRDRKSAAANLKSLRISPEPHQVTFLDRLG